MHYEKWCCRPFCVSISQLHKTQKLVLFLPCASVCQNKCWFSRITSPSPFSQTWRWSAPCSPVCSGLWGPTSRKPWSLCTIRTAPPSVSPRTCSGWKGTPPWKGSVFGRAFQTAERWRGWSRNWSWCSGRTRPSTRCCCCSKCASVCTRPWGPYTVRLLDAAQTETQVARDGVTSAGVLCGFVMFLVKDQVWDWRLFTFCGVYR